MARAFDPFREMDRWFADAARTPTSTAMPMDLYRDGDVFVTRIDLPGVDPAVQQSMRSILAAVRAD